MFNSTDGTVRDTNCRGGVAQGFVLVPALLFSVKNIGGAPSGPTVTKITDGTGRELVSEPLDNIECRDALLAPQVDTTPVRPERSEGLDGALSAALEPSLRSGRTVLGEALWPRADAVIGNPPFVGDRKMIRELGEEYTFKLREAYQSRVPGGADLVCYWFEKARVAIEAGDSQHAGFVATNSIRGGTNRKVMEKICGSANIVEAWSDEPWINDGAAVRVSLVAFDASSTQRSLNGNATRQIYADLSGRENDVSIDLTDARSLEENKGTAFVGVQRNGPFDIPGHVARRWLSMPNVNGVSNAKVLRRAYNAIDLTRRESDRWLIDFGLEKDQNAAALFEAAHAWVVLHVKPTREDLRRAWHANYWWLFGDPRPALRKAVAGIPRYVLTPQISKHRVFAFVPTSVLTENANIAIARADDVSFDILHSRFHELWSLRMCTWLGVGNDPRYTNTTTFETFPSPAGLTPRDTAHQRTEVLADGVVIPAGLDATVRPEPAGEGSDGAANPPARQTLRFAQGERISALRDHAINVARAAKRLNDLRERWLNPEEWTERVAEVIPLGMEVSPYPDRILPRSNLGAADLAELKKRTLTNLYNQRPAWLADAHVALDAAVAAAYGWADYSPAMTNNEILARLLALNQERAALA